MQLITIGAPGWGPRPKPDMSGPKWTHEGGVVRSKLHGMETRMNARWSGHERTMVWTWTHDGLDMDAQQILALNARIWSGAHDGLDKNARKSGHIPFRSGMVWTYLPSNARRTHEKFWTQDSLDISTFRLGLSGHQRSKLISMLHWRQCWWCFKLIWCFLSYSF